MKTIPPKGFTLLELILYISLAATLLLTLSIFLSTLIDGRVKHQAISEVETAGSFILTKIGTSIRNAEAINSPTQANSSTILSLDVVTSANDPTIFSVTDGVLSMKEGGQGGVAMHSSQVSITSLTFHNLTRATTPGNLKFSITLRYSGNNAANMQYEKTFYGSASLR